MKLLLINDSDESLNETFLNDWVKAMSQELSSRGVLQSEHLEKELSLVFLKETDAKLLNWNYRQKDYATDVLSFETEDPESIGELVMCPYVLKKQAAEHKISFDLEMGYMILHGVLHLMGYDHEKDPDEAEEMMRLQDSVFEKLTAPPPKKKATAKKAAAPKKKAAAKKKASSAKSKKPAAKAKKKATSTRKAKSVS